MFFTKISQVASPLKMFNRRKIGAICVLVSLLICVCVFFAYHQPRSLQKLIKWSKRKVAIKVMDVFKLTDAHRSGCLIKNEFIAKTRNALDDCGMCENMDIILDYNVTNGETAIDEVFLNELTRSIQNELPLVVHNYTHTLRDIDITISDLAYEIGDMPSTNIYKQCQYHSSMKAKYAELPHLLNYIATDETLPFYSFWENCASRAIKEFRTFYHRPAYLGGSVQLTGSNWMILCRNYTGKIYRQIELFSPFVMVIVQTGVLNIRLEAADYCLGICDDLEKTLYAGDTLLFSSNIYSLYYKPVCGERETVAIGVSGYIN